MTNKSGPEKKILKISLFAGIFFTLVELVMAVYSGSQAVLMDSVFDGAELLIIGLSIFLVPLFYKPVTEKKPFGYLQLETVFILLKGFMFLSVTIGLITSNVQLMLTGGNHVNHTLISIFELVLAAFSLLFFLILNNYNKSFTSPIVDAEIYGWKIDVLCSAGVAAAFLSQGLLSNSPLEFISPYFDQIIAIIIALCMLPGPLKMVAKAFKDMLLFAPDESITSRIRELVTDAFAKQPLEIEWLDITKTGRKLWVAVYFHSKSDELSIKSIQILNNQLHEQLCEEFDDVGVELIPALASVQ